MRTLRPNLVHAQQTFSHLKRAQSLETAPFTYTLPPERIANRPLPTRHDSNLLVVPRLHTPSSPSLPSFSNQIRSSKFKDIPSILPSSSLIIRNATRVIPARIPANKSTGGRAEILLLHPSPPQSSTSSPGTTIDPTAILSLPTLNQKWRAILGGRKLRPGDTLSTTTSNSKVTLTAEILERHETGEATISLTSNPSQLPLRNVLSLLGLPPLPPYIRREAEENDKHSFQTVYASHQHEGSVAAPTAGLHVTEDVMAEFKKLGIDMHDVVLHIGTATFRQVNADVAGGHDMHHESIAVSGRVLQTLIRHCTDIKPIVALVSKLKIKYNQFSSNIVYLEI